jgi:methionyl-tRNA formyltransferase
MNRELRIIYMGTPGFAVEPLRAILEAGYNVVAVITAPDKPAGRGQKLHISPVKEFALQNEMAVLQPVSLKDIDFISTLRALNANLQVVVAFRMLPEIVWQMPEFGTINLHASLLPQYRGAAPINHAIINGETETGLTTFFIEKEIDTGNIILSQKVQITPSDDAGSLHDRMMISGGEVLVKTLKMIENDTVKFLRQDTLLSDYSTIKTAPKIFRENCRINWEKNSLEIHNLVRGLSPAPGAFTQLLSDDDQPKQLKIYKTSYRVGEAKETPGTIITDGKSVFSVFTGDGLIHIEELQIEGKRRMTATEFLRGMQLSGHFRCI